MYTLFVKLAVLFTVVVYKTWRFIGNRGEESMSIIVYYA
jgi:hypothetical protein